MIGHVEVFIEFNQFTNQLVNIKIGDKIFERIEKDLIMLIAKPAP